MTSVDQEKDESKNFKTRKGIFFPTLVGEKQKYVIRSPGNEQERKYPLLCFQNALNENSQTSLTFLFTYCRPLSVLAMEIGRDKRGKAMWLTVKYWQRIMHGDIQYRRKMLRMAERQCEIRKMSEDNKRGVKGTGLA
jgi:hypothetical protein